MTLDWSRWCQANHSVNENDVTVQLSRGRTHRVRVKDVEDSVELSAIVVRPGVAETVPDLIQRLWRYNRTSQLVGFHRDPRGRLVARAWLPKLGLTGDEFVFVLDHVAREADRLEYLLSGRDEQ